MSEHGTQRKCLRHEIHQHGHELSFGSASFAHLCIQDAEHAAADQERCGQDKRAERYNPFRHQSKRHRCDKNSAAESDHTVNQFTFRFRFRGTLGPCKKAANERGNSCQSRGQNDGHELTHCFIPLLHSAHRPEEPIMRFLMPPSVGQPTRTVRETPS